MRYPLLFVLCFAYLNLSGQVVKDEFRLRGVDDSLNYSVKIEQNFNNETAIFSSQGHTVTIFGVQDLINGLVHADTFLEVQFRVRGGTGGRVRRNVLVCVSHGQVYKAMDFFSESVWRLTEVYDKVADSLKLFNEKSDYYATLSIKWAEGMDYNAVLLESTKVESKYDPSKNVSFEKPYELYFDPSGYFFYNSTKKLNKLYKVYLNKEHKTVEKFIGGEVPCIKLYERLYLRIDNEWYTDNGHDSLSCL